MLMDSQMKVRGPHNISGASQQNSIASFSQTTDVDGKLFQNLKKKQLHKKHIKWLLIVHSAKSYIYGNPKIQKWI